jgi:replication initiation and membrane attachment protein DnaB
MGNKKNRKKNKWFPDASLFVGHASEIRASTKPSRLYLDNEYFKKGYGAIFPHRVTAVYAVLAMFANHKTQICFPSAQTVMDMTGITNRNTYFEAIKILEAYDIVAIVHRSKGRLPNVYALMEHYGWNEVNDDNFDTVMKKIRGKKTVSKQEPQQYQKEPSNSNVIDTGNHISDSDNEIIPQNAGTQKQPLKGKQLLDVLTPLAKSVVTSHFRESDILLTLEKLHAKDCEIDKLASKEVIRELLAEGFEPVNELPQWMKI